MNKPDASGKTKSRILEGLEDKGLEKRGKCPCPMGKTEGGQSPSLPNRDDNHNLGNSFPEGKIQHFLCFSLIETPRFDTARQPRTMAVKSICFQVI